MGQVAGARGRDSWRVREETEEVGEGEKSVKSTGTRVSGGGGAK